MGHKLTAGLCFLVLILMVLASGCWWAGGGTMHHSIDAIRCDKPWFVKVMYKNDPKDWRVNLAEESKHFFVHYRVSSSGEFVTVPMFVEKLEPKLGRAYLKADMPPIPCNRAGEYVEYCYDHIASYCDCYNRSPIYKAVIVD